MNAADLFAQLDVELPSGGDLAVASPIDGAVIANVHTHSEADIVRRIANAGNAFEQWRRIPAPRRGELVRLFANELRRHKEPLAQLVTLECGKIVSEARGEVQEMIDICDFAVGLSRQLYGLTIASERPGHHMLERWHPLGVVGVISAFNFPVAVWCWNAAIAWVAGDAVVWKPSEKTPLTALACQGLFARVAADFEEAPAGLSELLLGGRRAGEQLVDDRNVALISATGSIPMGRAVGQRAAARFARTLLELGGNAGMVVCPSADRELAIRAITFAAAGTAGQRCTSLRRLIVHESMIDELVARLKLVYESLNVGDPFAESTLVGPLIDEDAYAGFNRAIRQAQADGGEVHFGNRENQQAGEGAYYVRPALALMPEQTPAMHQETFAPLLYVVSFERLEQAIAIHNAVPQGLSSCIFTEDMREAETFLSATGSDCGIANVNIGSSGAEIGGAFGGEKETGGGRESGSDAWKAYMRRQTQTVNYSGALPLAQGVRFDV